MRKGKFTKIKVSHGFNTGYLMAFKNNKCLDDDRKISFEYLLKELGETKLLEVYKKFDDVHLVILALSGYDVEEILMESPEAYEGYATVASEKGVKASLEYLQHVIKAVITERHKSKSLILKGDERN